jgi:hypothetical protein
LKEFAPSKLRRTAARIVVLALVVCVSATGCSRVKFPRLRRSPPEPPEGSVKIPRPINLLLPQSIHIHSFTGTRTFDEGGVKGIDVRIEAKDAYGDPTKAFGQFRFELYELRPHNPDRKGRLIMTWEEDVLEAKKNLVHWNIHRNYEFKLLWHYPIPVGQELVLRAVFSSPFTQRLYDERVLISGQ